MVRTVVVFLLIANIINIGADLGAMGAALRLLIGGNQRLYTVCFGLICVLAEIFIRYTRYARTLKWLTVSLFSYVAVVFVVHVPWRDALHATFVPHLALNVTGAMALVAVLGTTISPYLFFWQAALEVEDCKNRRALPLRDTPLLCSSQFRRIRIDTVVGMAVSNAIAIFIIYATAATLHANGVTTIETSAQAAEALRPIAGKFAFVIFATGIMGTGLLAVPVLAGSSAYALAETFKWREGLERSFAQAKLFYGTIAVATMVGVLLNFTALDPVKALYWSAVVNGVLAAPVMGVIMLLGNNPQIMGKLTLPKPMLIVGWVATLIMFTASICFFVF